MKHAKHLWLWIIGHKPHEENPDLQVVRERYSQSRRQLKEACNLADRTCDGVAALIKDQTK